MSVLLPLQDERDTAMQSVLSWTGQSAEPRSYEVVRSLSFRPA
jgi:hypothetical protein